jgi:hypothetical protein
MRGENGSVVISWALLTPIIFFVAFGGFVLLHCSQMRDCMAMAAREAAREYGISHSEESAKHKAWDTLWEEGLLPENSVYDQGMLNTDEEFSEDGRHFKIWLTDDGTWAKCTIEYKMPNALPLLPRLVAVEDNPSWWPRTFKFTAVGSAKHEFEME